DAWHNTGDGNATTLEGGLSPDLPATFPGRSPVSWRTSKITFGRNRPTIDGTWRYGSEGTSGDNWDLPWVGWISRPRSPPSSKTRRCSSLGHDADPGKRIGHRPPRRRHR